MQTAELDRIDCTCQWAVFEWMCNYYLLLWYLCHPSKGGPLSIWK